MSRTCVAAVAVLLAAPALADEPPGRAEITVFMGSSVGEIQGTTSPRFPLDLPAIYEQSTRLGAGALLGLRFTRAVAPRAALELEVAVAPSQQAEYRAQVPCYPGLPCPRGPVCRPDGPCALPPIPGLVPEYFLEAQLSAWHYNVGLSYELASSDPLPYLGITLGGATYSGLGTSQTDVRLGLLAGLKLGSGPLRGRLELADFVTTSHFLTGRTEHDLQVRAGLSLRLP